MYRIYLNQVNNKYEFEELIKIFLKTSEFQLFGADEEIENSKTESSETDIIIKVPDHLLVDNCGKADKKTVKNQIKRYLYDELRKNTGITPDWGILTGVRPVKLAGELTATQGSAEKAGRILSDEYYLSPEKARLLLDICELQSKILKPSSQSAVGLYIGIPFCPTRCVYCSFPSNQAKEKQIEQYLEALHREISFVAEQMSKKSWYPESIYIGGGTPTTLSAVQLDVLLSGITSSFDLTNLKEFTVEAGRPDTITSDKMQTLKKYNVGRISINPQSMNSATLEKIGRAHKPEDIIEAFRLARNSGIAMINTDIIAGLPGEEPEDFAYTLKTVIGLEPENITVHTLALKRASRLKQIDSDYNYKEGQKVKKMLEFSKKLLSEAGYHPYYLYRQKQMTGNFENVGYAKEHTDGIYNIRIMEETQTIIAMGAGGMTKVYYPSENRLERVANVSNFEIYIERLEEMLQRKAEHLFENSRNLQM